MVHHTAVWRVVQKGWSPLGLLCILQRPLVATVCGGGAASGPFARACCAAPGPRPAAPRRENGNAHSHRENSCNSGGSHPELPHAHEGYHAPDHPTVEVEDDPAEGCLFVKVRCSGCAGRAVQG